MPQQSRRLRCHLDTLLEPGIGTWDEFGEDDSEVGEIPVAENPQNSPSGGGGSAPAGWTCNPEYYDTQDGCDCECGIYDPDCDGVQSSGEVSSPTLYGCVEGAGAQCSMDGTCVYTQQ